jgi:hypothetical protein
MTTIVSFLLSGGGIFLAAALGHPSEGGRGGALAVALTFAMLFLGRGTAQRLLDDNDFKSESDDPDKKITHLRNALRALVGWQQKEKPYLFWASVVGTLAWGFGDLAASALQHCFPITR